MKPNKLGVSVLVVILLCIKLVNGQLEAVGAFMSVVPVTQILATAGLVGVKLAALSRLLQMLGYDQAYLASGGSGTAAQPIGLQKNYAYMFPYVPGLNVTIKGEHNFQPNMANSQQRVPGTRKTFPSMIMPGDYEHQSRPFRGSETLKEIFRESGLKVRFPSSKTSGLPSEGNKQGQVQVPIDPQPSYVPQNPNQHLSSSSSSPNVPPSSSASMIAPLASSLVPLSSQPSSQPSLDLQQPPMQTQQSLMAQQQQQQPQSQSQQQQQTTTSLGSILLNNDPNNNQPSSSSFQADRSSQSQSQPQQPQQQQSQPQQFQNHHQQQQIFHIPQTQHLRKPDQNSQVIMSRPHSFFDNNLSLHQTSSSLNPPAAQPDQFSSALNHHTVTLSHSNYIPFSSSTTPTAYQSFPSSASPFSHSPSASFSSYSSSTSFSPPTTSSQSPSSSASSPVELASSPARPGPPRQAADRNPSMLMTTTPMTPTTSYPTWPDEFHPIPQHEYYHRMVLANLRTNGAGGGGGGSGSGGGDSSSSSRPNDPLPIGQMLKPLEPVPNAFEDVDKLFEATGSQQQQPKLPQINSSNNDDRYNHPLPTFVSSASATNSNSNNGPDQNEYSTNLVPSSLVIDAPFNDEMNHNEFHFAHLLRRKRHTTTTTSTTTTTLTSEDNSKPNTSSNTRRMVSSSSLLGKIYPQGPLMENFQESLERDLSRKNFGMPATNINNMRKKRSPIPEIILSAIRKRQKPLIF